MTEYLNTLREALELGRESAYEAAQQFHAAMKGYKPARHKAMDDDVAKIDKDLSALDRLEAAAVPSREDVVRLAKLSGILINPALGVYADDESKLHFFAALCRTLPTGDEKCAPDPDCEYCQGTGEADSGGIHPWGAQASIRCRCTYPAVPVGEVKPVAWQRRSKSMDPDDAADPWSRWHEVPPGELDAWRRRVERDPEHYELRPVFTTPPAPIEGWRWVPVEPELASNPVNDACWAFVEAMPHQLPGPIWNALKPAVHAAILKFLAAAPQPGDKPLEEPAQVAPEHQARVDQMAADAEARREKERGILLEAANHLEGDGHFMPAEDADWAAGWIRRQIGAGATP